MSDLNASSLHKLKKVHPDLAAIVKRAAEISAVDFVVTCGIRTIEEQKKLLASGASRTLRSRHLPGKNGLSHAVDLAPVIDGKVRWDWPLFTKLNAAMTKAAKELKVQGLEWGGDWKSFKDGPHWQLSWLRYK